MPAFNSSVFISEAIDSVIKQTYPHWELIVVDDGSTDNTKEIVENYMRKDNRIIYFYQENCGPAAARNRGIQISKGRYIAFLDSDDIWYADKLEKQMHFIDSHPGYVVYGGAMYIWEKPGGFLESSESKTFKSFDTIRENLEYFLFHPNLTITSAVLLEKSMLERVTLFDESLESSEDDHLYFRLAAQYKFFPLNDPVYYRRRHAKNIMKKFSLPDVVGNRFLAVEKFVREAPAEILPNAKSHILSYWCLVFSRQLYHSGIYTDSFRWFLKGGMISPGYYFMLVRRKVKQILMQPFDERDSA
jgi:glycosyltransferase involved in cell wall biosynthesis